VDRELGQLKVRRMSYAQMPKGRAVDREWTLIHANKTEEGIRGGTPPTKSIRVRWRSPNFDKDFWRHFAAFVALGWYATERERTRQVG
jgi:hypothetical protein